MIKLTRSIFDDEWWASCGPLSDEGFVRVPCKEANTGFRVSRLFDDLPETWQILNRRVDASAYCIRLLKKGR